MRIKIYSIFIFFGFLAVFPVFAHSSSPVDTASDKCAISLREMAHNPMYQSIHRALPDILTGAIGRTAERPWFRQIVIPLLERFMQLKQLALAYADSRELHSDQTMPEGMLRALNIQTDINSDRLFQLPKTGGLVVVANHPFGIADGLALYRELKRVRSDLKCMTTTVFNGVPEAADPEGEFILFDAHNADEEAAKEVNSKALVRVFKHLKRGHALLVFPAAQVSHYQKELGRVVDQPWKSQFLELALRVNAMIVPAFVEGRNSRLFYFAKKLNPWAPSATLAREFLNKRNRTIYLQLGRTYAAGDLLKKYDPKDPSSGERLAQDFRQITYDLEPELKARLRRD